MSVPGASRIITQTVTQWEGVIAAPHRFGGIEYRLGRREIGHIHGDHMVDIPSPTAVRNELVAADLAQLHHILPDSGWISYYLHTHADVQTAIALLQRSDVIAQQQRQRRAPSPAYPGGSHDRP